MPKRSPEFRQPQHTEKNMVEALEEHSTPEPRHAEYVSKDDLTKRIHGQEGRRAADQTRLAQAKDTVDQWAGRTITEDGPPAVDVAEGTPAHLVEAHRPKSALEKLTKWFKGK